MAKQEIRKLQTLFNAEAVNLGIELIAHGIIDSLKGNLNRLVLLGIVTRGAPIAERLSAKIKRRTGVSVSVGYVDASRYDDELNYVDESREAVVRGFEFPDEMPSDPIFAFVDDVLYTGGTVDKVRQRLLAKFPKARTMLGVLVYRPGFLEVAVGANWCAKTVETEARHVIHVHLKETDGEDGIDLMETYEVKTVRSSMHTAIRA